MTRGGALGAWRMVWLEAHREAVGVAPHATGGTTGRGHIAVVHQAVDVWIRHCLRPDANCVRAATSGGLGLRLDKQTDFMCRRLRRWCDHGRHACAVAALCTGQRSCVTVNLTVFRRTSAKL